MARAAGGTGSPRAQQILDVARTLFRARGYAGVSVDAIGAALGISGPAIYRHFRGKGAVLEAIVDDAATTLETVATQGTREGTIDALVGIAVGGAHIGSVLGAEARHLPDADRVRLEGRIAAALQVIGARLHPQGTVLAPFVARSAVAIAGSPAFYGSALPSTRREGLIAAALRALVDDRRLAEVPVRTIEAPRVLERPWLPRDEAVLAAVPELLLVRGSFDEVSIEDLGAAAGLSGPSVYTYFDGKRDVAFRGIERTMAWATSSLQQALAFSSDSADVMRRALRDYVELSARIPVFSAPLEMEEGTFDEAALRRVESFVSSYRELWVACAAASRPGLEPAAAEVALWAAHAVVNAARMMPVGSAVPPDDELLVLAETVFTA